MCVTQNPTIYLDEQPNSLKILTALRLLESQIVISPVLYDEYGNIFIPQFSL